MENRDKATGVENILIIRLDAIGDMILTSGFIREVRANFPSARITLVCSPRVRPVVELCPYINRLLTFDIQTLDRNIPTMQETLADFCKENFGQEKISIAFSPQWGSDNLPALLMARLSDARERIGYGSYPYAAWLDDPPPQVAALDNFLLTKNIVTPRNVVSEADKTFYLLEAVGLAVNRRHMELFFGEEDFSRAKDMLRNVPPTCKKVLLGIGAGGESRKYPADKYLVALKELVKKNLVFVIVGGKAELNDANFIERNMPHGKVLNLVGKTTLRETEAVISQADFYIGNDSGVMHMAAAAQVPVLALYREAQDKEEILPGIFSEFRRFPPLQTQAVILRPDRQLADCERRGRIYGWCHHAEAHCITKIPPQGIVAAFETLESIVNSKE